MPDWAHDLVPLDRPLAVIDLETTGTAPYRDRIVEIAVVKIHPDGWRETRRRRVNPGIPIPRESTAIHGIRDQDVAREPEFRQIAASLAEYLEGCDLAGFGVSMFDLPLLRAEFERAGVEFRTAGRRVIDAKTIYHLKEPRHLAAAHEFYCGASFEGAHSAEADAQAAYRVLLGQLRRYPDLPHTMEALHRFCNRREADYLDSEGKLIWQGNEAVFQFGKHRGEPLREVCVTDPEYVHWLASGEAPAELRSILAAALQGRLPERAGRRSPAERAAARAERPGPGRGAAPSLFDGQPAEIEPVDVQPKEPVEASSVDASPDRDHVSGHRRGWRRLLEWLRFWTSRRSRTEG
jgi:DNA polymerase-3 subunit epsilon